MTADDFGRDAPCTKAIAENLLAGAVTSASIMANGRHFNDACEAVLERGLQSRIGVHLCLDEGPPLSREMRRYADRDGNLCLRRTLMPLGPSLAGAIEAELSAQIERVVASGIQPTHLDSHRHFHTMLPIARIVVRLAKRYGIRYIRPARDLAPGGTVAARAYKWSFNRYLAARAATADHFDDLVDFCGRPDRHAPGELIECMVHLDESARGNDGRRLLASDGFAALVERYELVSQGELN